MKYPLLSLLFSALLVGCSSGTPTDQSDSFKTMSGGQSVGDTTSLYWYTERMQFPYSASDYVTSGDYGWYQSDYRWKDSKLKEVVREGEIFEEGSGLVDYKAHLRFNDNGEAVYQRFRVDGKVLPMKPDQIAHMQREAAAISTVVVAQEKKGEKLFQGYWDGERFTTCEGVEYKTVEFNHTLPTFVIKRLANLDSYAAFIGKSSSDKITISDIYLLHDDDFDCIQPVSYIED